MELEGVQHHFLLCNGKTCLRNGAEEVTKALRDEINKQQLTKTVHTSRTHCNGRCKDACTVVQYPEGYWFKQVNPEMARQLIRNIKTPNRIISPAYEFKDGSFKRV